MAKQFKTPLGQLLGTSEAQESSAPKKKVSITTKVAETKAKPPEKVVLARTTAIMSEQMLEQVKALAYWERRKIQDVLSESVEGYLKKQDPKLLKESLEAYRNRLD